jgi:hypothetical protein
MVDGLEEHVVEGAAPDQVGNAAVRARERELAEGDGAKGG